LGDWPLDWKLETGVRRERRRDACQLGRPGRKLHREARIKRSITFKRVVWGR